MQAKFPPVTTVQVLVTALVSVLMVVATYAVIRYFVPFEVGYPSLTPSPVEPTPIVANGGFLHEVDPGESVSSVAELYRVNARDIAKVNRLLEDSPLPEGQSILIPLGTDESAWEYARIGIWEVKDANGVLASALTYSPEEWTREEWLAKFKASFQDDGLDNAQAFLEAAYWGCQPGDVGWDWLSADAFVEEDTITVISKLEWEYGACAAYPPLSSMLESYDVTYLLERREDEWYVTGLAFIPTGSVVVREHQ